MGEANATVAIIGTRGYPSYYGGFETAVRRLAPHLADRGWNVRVYGRRNSAQPQRSAADPRVEVVVTRGFDSTSLSTLTFGLTATLHAIRHKPDVALVMNVANGFWLPLLKARRIRSVVNVDGIEWHRQKWNWLGKLVFKLGAWLTARFADELVFDAHAIGDYWRKRLHRDGTFIPYGADEAPTLPLKDDLEPNEYVLLVARFVPENTVPEFLEAAKLISQHCDVVLVGSAAQQSPINAQAADLSSSDPRIHWLGHVSDDDRLFALWQHSAVYFHGHSVGGTNPALVQAMALGARVVARDTVYNREVLGDAATYCGADPSDIAENILRALDGSADDYRSRATIRARRIYTWDSVCSAYEEVLETQLSR